MWCFNLRLESRLGHAVIPEYLLPISGNRSGDAGSVIIHISHAGPRKLENETFHFFHFGRFSGSSSALSSLISRGII
jgi:hypothetical protein